MVTGAEKIKKKLPATLSGKVKALTILNGGLMKQVGDLEKENKRLIDLIDEKNIEIIDALNELKKTTNRAESNDKRIEDLLSRCADMDVRVAQVGSTIEWYAFGAKQDRSRSIQLYETMEEMNESIHRANDAVKHLFTSFISLHTKNVDLEEIHEINLRSDVDLRGTVPLSEVLRMFKYVYNNAMPRRRPMMSKDWMNESIDMKGRAKDEDEDAGDWLNGEPKT